MMERERGVSVSVAFGVPELRWCARSRIDQVLSTGPSLRECRLRSHQGARPLFKHTAARSRSLAGGERREMTRHVRTVRVIASRSAHR
jgi:hypothetical protein